MKMKTVQEVAEIFQVHRHTVDNWIKRGKITAVRIGRSVRIPPDEVQRLIRENQVK